MSNNYKVRLTSSINRSDSIMFDVTPELNESRNVNYKQIDIVHMPGTIQAYGNSSTRTFQMVVKLIARTSTEATINAQNLQLMRSWTLPYFGKSTNGLTSAQIENRDRLNSNRKIRNKTDVVQDSIPDYGLYKNLLGQPPEILYLNAYTDFTKPSREGFSGNINNIPVVITQLGNNYPADVTYINTNNNEPFPVIMNVDILMTEVHSPAELSNFSLSDYKSGKLLHF